MIWSVIADSDIFYSTENAFPAGSVCCPRSSNPFDYVRRGYTIDNASMFGGKDIVDYNSDIPGNRPGVNLYFSLI